MKEMMKCALVFFTKKGENIYNKIKDNEKVLGIDIELKRSETKLSRWTKEVFESKDVLIFISATGIAVRSIAPYLKGKTKDPAVIVVDDMGNFVISLVSGHVGGANAIAQKIAKQIEAVPVITTSTDVSGKFAVDAWATQKGLFIDDIKPAKDISMKIINDEKIPISSVLPLNIKDEQIVGIYEMPTGLENDNLKELQEYTSKAREMFLKNENKKFKALGINVSWSNDKVFEKELKLVPKTLTLGIGCRRGKTKEEIKKIVDGVTREFGIHSAAIKNIASIDLKKEEKGIIDFAYELGVEFVTFNKRELLGVKGEFTESEFVENVVGVSNVCERAAVVGSINSDGKQGKIILRKRSLDGVTLAIATQEVKLDVE